MAGVRLRDRSCAIRYDVADQGVDPLARGERGRVDTELLGQSLVEGEQLRRRCGCRLPRHVQPVELADVGVVKREQRSYRDAHRANLAAVPPVKTATAASSRRVA